MHKNAYPVVLTGEQTGGVYICGKNAGYGSEVGGAGTVRCGLGIRVFTGKSKVLTGFPREKQMQWTWMGMGVGNFDRN